MDTSVYIFIILLDVFIVFTIFAIYLYVLFRYYLHTIEVNGINHFFNKHLEIYKPIFRIIKQYTKKNIDNDNVFIKKIQKNINESEEKDTNNFSIGTIIILTTILGLFLILLIYFGIFYKKIIAQVSLISVLFTIFINLILIVGFELIFLYFVYCNIDVINIQHLLNI